MKFKKRLKQLEDFKNGDIPIGESFEYNGIDLKCIKFHTYCDLCYFHEDCNKGPFYPTKCVSVERKDGISAMFIKI